MISTILTSLHALIATLIFSAAVLIFLAKPRKVKTMAIGLILVLYSLSSIAYSLSVNSISLNQITPWLLIEITTTYSVAPATVLVSLIILRPKVSKNLLIAIPLWICILAPPVLSILDLTNISQAFFSKPLLLSLGQLAEIYTGGYISIDAVTTPLGKFYLPVQLYFFYTIWIFYPNLFVYLKDRKTDRKNSINSIVLLFVAVLGSIATTVLLDILPITGASLLANTIISFGFFLVAIRLIREGSHTDAADSWVQVILKSYPMFTKLAITIGLIVIPTIIFITFSSFSFFQNSLLNVANENLKITTHHGADSTIDQIETKFHILSHFEESYRTQSLVTNRVREYENLSQTQISQLISNRNDQWIKNDLLLISLTMDPVKNSEYKLMIEENPTFLNVILVDNAGGLITASEKPEIYDFTNQVSWQFTAENDRPFIGQIYWDDEIHTYSLEIAQPLHNAANEVIAIAIAQLNMTDIITNLQKFEQNNVNFGLADLEGRIIPSSGSKQDEYYLPVFSLEPTMSGQAWRTYQVNNESSLVRTSQVFSSEFRVEAPWLISATQPVSQALAPLTIATVTAFITAGIIITISTLIIISLSQSIARPISRLNDAAKKILEGETEISLAFETTDEIGTLANSFNQMSTDLNNLLRSLENKIDSRTKDLQKRAVQLEASAAVASRAAEIREVSTLLDLVVNLISDKLNYYHVGIFLLDQQNRYAVLQAANSEGGKRMLARHHKLQVGRVGVVGYVAGIGLPRIAQDVGADVVYYDNPDMPNTRSEMALPLKVRDQVIGVLDVQSTEANAFTQEDIEVLQVLADQLALAIDNTLLYESSQKALEELQTLYGQDTAKAWRQRLTGKEISFAYDSTGLTRLVNQDSIPQGPDQAALSKAISLRGQVIGNLNFIREGQETEWSEDENILIEEILEQTALALENARLVNQIRLRSDQIQLLQEITALAASVLDENELLESVTRKLQTSLGVQHCGILLVGDNQEFVEMITSSSSMSANITTHDPIRIEEDPISQRLIKNPQILVLQDIAGEPKYQTFVHNFTTMKFGSLILMPLIIREQVVGIIFLENEDKNRTIDMEEENLFNQISSQISSAMESARLFAAEQEGRIAAAALLEITQIASASLNMNQVLNRATNRSAQAIQAHRCTIFLLDEKEKIKPLISIYADGTEMSEDEWQILKDRVHQTYENVSLHRLAANLRSPKIISNPLTYQNIPFNWAVDFGIENMLLVPLISQNKVIGTMIFDQIDRNLTFKQNQEELAQTIAGQIATTIENANLFEQTVRRAERERKVTEITAKIRSSNDPQKIMETAISELRIALNKSGVKAKPSATPYPNQHQKNPPSNGNDKAQN